MATSQSLSLVGSLDADAPRIIHGDAFEWLKKARPNSIHAVVTDPPYGLVEYTPRQLEKLREGHGGVWRIPPAFDNAVRKPLPRFTVLNDDDKDRLEAFFERLAALLMPVLVPARTSSSLRIRSFPTSFTCPSSKRDLKSGERLSE